MQTACDKNGWILGYSVNPGNQHDSRTFKSLYDKIKDIGIQTLVADAGYKTPAIAKLLLDDGITPLLPYKRPMTQDGFFKKAEYVYDEYFDCYVCPNDQVLALSYDEPFRIPGIQEQSTGMCKLSDAPSLYSLQDLCENGTAAYLEGL